MSVSDWDAYWRSARLASVGKDSGPRDAMLERFWFQLFKQFFSTFHTCPKLLDIACGSGAIARHAIASIQSLNLNTGPQIFGLDTSLSALQEIQKHHPDIQCVLANAALLPFHDDIFDLVTSQFGIEYAGIDAMNEAARIIRPGGMIAAVLHLHGGGIYKECAVNLDAINDIRHSEILRYFEGIFRAALAVQQQQASTEQFLQADKKFAGSVKVVEQVLQRWGKGVADGILFRLYNDIAHMYKRFKVYDPNEVYAWSSLMGNELDTYSGRMASMLKAALDEATMNLVIRELSERKFTIRLHEKLKFENAPIPAAWVLIGEKTAS